MKKKDRGPERGERREGSGEERKKREGSPERGRWNVSGREGANEKQSEEGRGRGEKTDEDVRRREKGVHTHRTKSTHLCFCLPPSPVWSTGGSRAVLHRGTLGHVACQREPS